MALFVEEAASNIVANGKMRGLKKLSADYRIAINGRKVSIMLCGWCEYFGSLALYEIHKDTSPENVLGIKIVMKLADDVRYFSAFNSNNIMICMYTNQKLEGDNI